jgi:hypothetical protein
MTAPDPKSVATECLYSWSNGDLDKTRSLMTDDVTFRGPLGKANGVNEYIDGLKGLVKIVDSVVQRKVLTDGDDVCIMYDLVTKTPAGSIPTVGWYHVRNGKVDSVTAYFDPRPLVPG